jgi:parvulin-like peptidyl-prolyl isomerase
LKGIAATVNGQPIAETAVQRGLRRVPPAKHAEARPEILDFLIENVLIDQYLVQQKVDVPQKEVDDQLEQIRAEIKKQGQTFEKMLQDLMLTEDELRQQICCDLRWDKYAGAQATDKALRELFQKHPEMFDGTMVRARHILLTPPSDNPQAVEQAKVRLIAIKKQIETEVAQGLAKLPPQTDNLAREQARTRLMEDAFSAMATKESACPSKTKGGDIGWFPRAGSMVEPFAKAAFALKPFTLSDTVPTQFGYHLILITERKPGKEAKFEEVQSEVKEIYSDQLREALCARLRPAAKIAITPPPKP